MKKIVCFLLAVFATFSFSFATSALLNDDPEEEAIPLQTNEPGEGYWGICYVKGEAIMNCPCNEDSDCPDLWGDKPYCGVL